MRCDRERGTLVAILIQHVILKRKKKESDYEQLKTIDSEGNFGYGANMKGGSLK